MLAGARARGGSRQEEVVIAVIATLTAPPAGGFIGGAPRQLSAKPIGAVPP